MRVLAVEDDQLTFEYIPSDPLVCDIIENDAHAFAHILVDGEGKAGGDDCTVKPFAFTEPMPRIGAQARRPPPLAAAENTPPLRGIE